MSISRAETQTFPGFAGVGALADHARFIADHHAHVRRVAPVTDSALAPAAEFMANHVVGMDMRHYSFAESATALAWLTSPCAGRGLVWRGRHRRRGPSALHDRP
jgi:hypothetical protein